MIKSRLTIATLACVVSLSLTGCYTARVVGDTEPSATVVKKEWAHSFLNGLVPPEEVDVSEECSNGIHRVETKLSFLNLLAAGITFGIYSPMTITVTCAR